MHTLFSLEVSVSVCLRERDCTVNMVSIYVCMRVCVSVLCQGPNVATHDDCGASE